MVIDFQLPCSITESPPSSVDFVVPIYNPAQELTFNITEHRNMESNCGFTLVPAQLLNEMISKSYLTEEDIAMGTTLPTDDSPGIITMAVSDPSKIASSLTAGINQWVKFDENPS